MSKSRSELIEYVYHPEKSPEDFQQVRITFKPSQDGSELLVILESDIEMTYKDIEGILLYLQQATLKRKHISLYEDCKVLVLADGQEYRVTLTEALAVSRMEAE